ncbi:hypothetical protein ACQP1O_34275 [Nocardia sp. CA-151230]|uniref:hypothetical protein n=1 Tax=Nocardia sp. CA-151230 TaxID=3239982 RepID=UPI003D8E0F19
MPISQEFEHDYGRRRRPWRLPALGRESARELAQESTQAAVATRTRVLRGPGSRAHRNYLLRTERGPVLLSGPGGGQRREILPWANGRRSCRDIAKLLCRGLYAVNEPSPR